MLKLGVIVNAEIDEINRIILIHRKQIYNNQMYRITVMPTLDCNFNCWYCYEEHSKEKMSGSIQKAILKHIRQVLDENNLKLLSLDWFGGEPLLYFNDVVYSLSSKIKRECEKHSVSFTNGITTNGALITNDMLKKLNSIALFSYQITLDGHELHHNQVKKTSLSHNEYRNILNVLFNLCESIEKLTLLVRINYSPKNIDNIHKIIDDIPIKYRDKMSISFQQVWQTQHESLDLKIKSIIEKFIAAGFRIEKPNIENAFHKCYADVINQVVITPNGDVFKCTARDFINHKPDGILQNDGSIEWHAPYYNRLSKTTIEYEKCYDCKVLPACWGPCSQKLLEYQKGDFEKICNINGVEKTIENMMADFYETRIIG
ncbi:MAG: 4Fe-4S cluster-binding domain-containing protein [Bacteroidales bacterium]|jgi:uncharacterized protein|nr:4Fe-4S cluster-binding domain-containing protein [Bacteroidales bacterium]